MRLYYSDLGNPAGDFSEAKEGSAMKLELERREDIAILRIKEDITFTNNEEFRRTVEKVTSSDARHVVFDFAEAGFINSSALAVIAMAFNAMSGKGGKVVLLNVQPEVERVFKIIGFDDMMPMASTEEEALKLCSS